MDRRAMLAWTGVALGGALTGCTARSEGEKNYDVGMSATSFLPERLAVDVGETVVWRNTGSRSHTVTAYEGALPDDAAYFSSGGFEGQREAVAAWEGDLGGAIFSGETYEHTFDVPGEHPYFCIPHERRGMIGSIVVEG